jgi:protein-tyrosine phosphatase
VHVLRRTARWLLDALDRTLHTARRARARRRLRSLRNPSSILVICQGNICRSPYAEAALRRADLLRDRNIVVRSAGFVGPGRPAPPEALAVAGRRGLDMGAHESRLMELRELRSTDLLVVMDRRQQRSVAAMANRPRRDVLLLGDLDPEPIRKRTVRDPWGQEEPVFEEVYDRIDRCVAELARELNASSVVPGVGGE